MYARVSQFELGGASRDDAVRAFESTRETVEQMPGIQAAFLLVDPDGGKALTITLWESEDALRATAEQARAVRERSASGAGLTEGAVESYEVAVQFGLGSGA
jgi:heme-degrading monooxygenase HmoA